MTQESPHSGARGTKPIRVYLLFRDDIVFKAYLDRGKAHQAFEDYADWDYNDKYTWCITSKELS